jgi:hypothetical protein
VGFAFVEFEDAVDVEPRVHARDTATCFDGGKGSAPCPALL